MPMYEPSSRSEAPKRLIRDEAGVSEVVGYIIMFGILSMITVISMLTFNDAQASTQDRVVELRADSAAARVAGAVVTAALFAEDNEGNDANFTREIELQQLLDGRAYTVALLPDDGTDPDRIEVDVAAIGYTATAPLFSAGATPQVTICAGQGAVEGGVIAVRYATQAGKDPGGVCPAQSIFLEAA